MIEFYIKKKVDNQFDVQFVRHDHKIRNVRGLLFDQIGRKALKGVNFDSSSGSKGGTL